ncbi:MAG: ABC transporter ATP-binding protein [Hyphomicrobiales bacterium]
MSTVNATGSKITKRFWQEYISIYKLPILLTIFLVIIVAGGSAVYPLLINWSYNTIDSGNIDKLYIIILIIPLVAFLKGVTNYLQINSANKISLNIVGNFQKDFFAKILKSNIEIIEENGPANLISRINNDSNLIAQSLERVINSLFKDGLTVIVLIGTMFYLNWKLALITFISLPFVIIPIYKIGQKINKISRDSQIQLGFLTTILNQSFQNIQTIKSYQLEERETINVNSEISQRINFMHRLFRMRYSVLPIIEIIAGVSIAILIIYAGIQINSGASTLGELTAFITALLMLSEPIRSLGTLNAIYQEGLAALLRQYKLYDDAIIINDSKNAIEFNDIAENIIFDNVSFQYSNSDRKILDNVCFNIKKNTRNYIIGESGSGKTTIFKLLLRLYEASDGKIFFDNNEINKYKLSSIRSNISAVFQNTLIFNDSLYNNINLNNQNMNINFESLIQDLNINEFSNKLSKKLDTIIGIDGVSLSGGEMQRIAIARAIIKNSPILLLDEATNSLDSINELEINKTLDKYFEEKTVIIIAHKLSTIKNADNIIVLKNGKVMGEGNYKSLEKNNQYFNELIHSSLIT